VGTAKFDTGKRDDNTLDMIKMNDGTVNKGRSVDASVNAERQRQRRLLRTAIGISIPLVWIWWRQLSGNPVRPGLPQWVVENPIMFVPVFMLVLLTCLIFIPLLASGRSPHVTFRPSDSKIRLDDVVGAEGTKREAIDTLNLFLSHETFAGQMGGNPRRGVLFEGPPGTGKTYLAKAMAAEAGVPFLFVSASAFQSMYYGQTNKKIRTYFKALRKAARSEGGAIGFIEEFDAIGGARSGMGGNGSREGISGVVNELLVQMQSFDMPMGSENVRAWFVDFVNRFLPAHRALRRPEPRTSNILVVAATNRAADLDPALLRPGRFDRIIHFGLPARTDRVAIADYYLGKKSHDIEVSAEFVADLTAGYTPVKIERLLDEALVMAVRHSRNQMTCGDLVQAKLTTEVGLAQEVGYHPNERRRIAIHEAGHALTAALAGRDIKVASILRRSDALGLVAHGDSEERHLHTPTEALELIVIALAGRAAESQEFGEASSGIAGDLAAATTLASQMVGSFGAGTSLISLEAALMPAAGNLVAKVLSDERSRVQVEEILERGADRAACLVLDNRDALMRIADALIERDELTGPEVVALLKDPVDVAL
jgi:ATP-dependent Zn protease